MNVAALFAMPFVILFSVILSCVFKENGYVPISPEGLRGIYFPVLYAGVNCLLSSRIIIDSTRGLTLKNKCLVSVCVSVFLTICIFAISSCIKDESGEMPFAKVVSQNVICSIIFDIIMIFSIFTSLVSSVYTSFSVINGKTSAIKKIIVTLVIGIRFFEARRKYISRDRRRRNDIFSCYYRFVKTFSKVATIAYIAPARIQSITVDAITRSSLKT